MRKKIIPENVLITGGSSGIGAALVVEYARRGAKNIFICGRSEHHLNEVIGQCSDGSAKIHGKPVDVTDRYATENWIRECDSIAPLHLIMANAGVAAGGEETPERSRRIFDINVGGVQNTVFPAIEIFTAEQPQRSMKQIAIMASIAGYHGLPSCPAYSASKACVKAWGAGLRGSLCDNGIMVNTICPGFIRSRLTDKNKFKMPFFMEADKAARIIINRLERNIGLIAFPWPMRLVTWGGAALPDRISEWLYRKVRVSF